MIETSSGDVDLVGPPIGFIRQRRSATTAKGSPRSRLRLIPPWCSFHELELRTFYYYPSYCLSPGGSSAVCTMTICTDADLGRRAKAHLATITATGNLILFHASHRKLGISGQHRDDLSAGGLRKRARETIERQLRSFIFHWFAIHPWRPSCLVYLIDELRKVLTEPMGACRHQA